MSASRHLPIDGRQSIRPTVFQTHCNVLVAFCLLLLLPAVGLALVGAPTPWLRDLCAGGGGEMQAPSCGALFGDVEGFILCDETAETCRFNARLDQSTCHQLCRSLGSTCVAAFDNQAPNCMATPSNMDTCLTQRDSEICVCERRDDILSQRVRCEAAFGEAADFTLCSEGEDRCEFAARTERGGDQGNCNDLCRRFNTKCLGARDNQSNCVEAPNNMDDCSTNRNNEICICERPFEP